MSSRRDDRRGRWSPIVALVTFGTALMAGAGLARADCAETCRQLLCDINGPRVIVTGTIEKSGQFGRRLTVENVVLELDAGAAPAIGDCLDFDTARTFPEGPGLAYLFGGFDEGQQTLFLIDENGKVQCGGESAFSSAPAGSGITPGELAAVANREAAVCSAAVAAKGYSSPDCDDTVDAIGCRAVAGPASGGPDAALLLIGLGLAWLQAASRRPGRRRQH